MNIQSEKPSCGVRLRSLQCRIRTEVRSYAAEMPKCRQRVCSWEHDSAEACFAKSTDKLEALQNDAAEKRPCNTSFNKS